MGIRTRLLLSLPVFFFLLFPLASQSRAARRTAPPLSGSIIYRYEIVPTRSRVSFTFRGLALPFDGHFSVIGGELFLGGPGAIPESRAKIWIRSHSVKAAGELQTKMLQSLVLDADRYESIELEITGAEEIKPVRRRKKEKLYSMRLHGRLRMHGVERNVTFSIRLADTGTELFIRGATTIRLSDFDMSRPRVLLLIPGSDTVEVFVRFVARPAPKTKSP